MSIRPVIAFLLIVALTMTAVGHTRDNVDDSSTETNDTQLTPDEEWEARSIAQQFATRFEESDDLLSIVDDLYVKDFDERLSRDPADRFLVPIASDLAEQVKGGELRRCHITSLKFTYLYMMLLSSAWHKTITLRGDAKPMDDENTPGPNEMLPPRVIALLKNDPALREVLLEESKKDDDSKNGSEINGGAEEQTVAVDNASEKRDDDRDLTIKSIERLRAYISTLEQAIALMREHLRTLPVPQTWQNMMDSMRELIHEPDSGQVNARVTILTRADFGCPKGTRLICLKVLLFHMDLIRVDGQLKILHVHTGAD
jgi:hypothetical protein